MLQALWLQSDDLKVLSGISVVLFTVRRYAKRCICRHRVTVCVCVCLSHSGIVSKRLNLGSRK